MTPHSAPLARAALSRADAAGFYAHGTTADAGREVGPRGDDVLVAPRQGVASDGLASLLAGMTARNHRPGSERRCRPLRTH